MNRLSRNLLLIVLIPLAHVADAGDSKATVEVWSCWDGKTWVLTLKGYRDEISGTYTGKVVIAESADEFESQFLYHGIDIRVWSWGGAQANDFNVSIHPNGRGEFRDNSNLGRIINADRYQQLSCERYPELED